MKTQWRLEDIAKEKRPTLEQKKWVAERFMESTASIRAFAIQHGFKYNTVKYWIKKVKANVELKPYGKAITTVSLSVIESCPLVVELRSRGLTLYEHVKELQPDLKRLIVKEFRRGVLTASIIGSLVGISESRVYSYVKKVKKNESYSFQKTPTNFENCRGNKNVERSSDTELIESEPPTSRENSECSENATSPRETSPSPRESESSDTTCDEMDEDLDPESM